MDSAGVILGLEHICPPVYTPLCERLDSPTPLLLQLTPHICPYTSPLLTDPHSINGSVRPHDIYIGKRTMAFHRLCRWWFELVDNNLPSLKWNCAHLAQDLQAQHLPHETKKVKGLKKRSTQVVFPLPAIMQSNELAHDSHGFVPESLECDYWASGRDQLRDTEVSKR